MNLPVPPSKRVMNLAQLLRQAAQRHGDKIGLAWGQHVWRWAELEHRAEAMAAALRARGIIKNDKVLVLAKNSNQMFELMFACWRLGAVWVPANFRQSQDEIAYLASASDAVAFICQGEFTPHEAAARKAALSIRFSIAIGGAISGAAFGDDYNTLVARHMGEPVAMVDVEHDDPCWFFFTSGTTGRPKAGILTHGQMGFVVTSHLCDLMPGTDAAIDASLAVAPLSHGAGIHLLAQVARAVKTVLPESDRFDAAQIWQLVERWRITNMFTVPTIVKMLTEHNAVDEYDHSSLRYVIYAGAPMYRQDQKHALQKLGPVLVQYFGLGEVTGNITVLPPALHSTDDGPNARVGTCGYARTAMQISIQSDSGNELLAGETGEICVCGLAVFAGYYNNPQANEKSFRNGWFRTGDLGFLDGQGFLFITGRASDMYISGGSNVYPREVEETLLAHPLLREAAIIGVPDPVWGEVGIAIAVLRPGERLSEPQLLEWLAPKVARYKMPKKIFFWDELPKSGYGKITKKLIRDQLAEQDGLLSDHLIQQ